MAISSAFRIAAFAICIAATGTARAQQPANDAWANRTVVSALPFSASQPLAGNATNDATDPDPVCRGLGSNPLQFSIWFGFTTGPTTEYLSGSIGGSDLVAIMAVYTGSPGSFRIASAGCGRRGGGPGFPPRFSAVRLAPNTSYSILVGSQFAVAPGTPFIVNLFAAPRLQVTKPEDTNDGLCDGDCSLREAIAAANAAGGAVIVPAGAYAIALAGSGENGNNNGDFDLAPFTSVFGAGPGLTIVDASGLDRVFDFAPSSFGSPNYGNIALGDLTLRGGVTQSSASTEAYGAGVRLLDGEMYWGLDRVEIAANTGAIIFGSGSGGFFGGNGTIRRSSVHDNAGASNGGGLYLTPGTRQIDVEDSAVYDNTATQGGGIVAQGDVTVGNSTIARNRGFNRGGGIWQLSGRLAIASSTIVDNRGSNSDFASGTGAGLDLEPSNGTNSITNTILARNTVGNPGDPSPDCVTQGAAPARSYTLMQAGSACGPSGTGDIVGLDPLLSTALAANGGPTRTYALLSGSPALNVADPAGCRGTDSLALANDQRGPGFPRVVGARCDIGALESPTVFPPGAPVLDPASDTGGFNNDFITSDSTPRVTGDCFAGTNVELDVDDSAVAPLSVPCTSGSYDWTPAAPLADGWREITARTLAPGGPSLQSPPLTVRIDTLAPTSPVITGPAILTSTTSNVLGTIGESASIVVLEGAVQVGATFAVSGGTWVCSVALATTGQHVLRAYAFDIAGNTSAVGPNFTVTVVDDVFTNGFE